VRPQPRARSTWRAATQKTANPQRTSTSVIASEARQPRKHPPRSNLPLRINSLGCRVTPFLAMTKLRNRSPPRGCERSATSPSRHCERSAATQKTATPQQTPPHNPRSSHANPLYFSPNLTIHKITLPAHHKACYDPRRINSHDERDTAMTRDNGVAMAMMRTVVRAWCVLCEGCRVLCLNPASVMSSPRTSIALLCFVTLEGLTSNFAIAQGYSTWTGTTSGHATARDACIDCAKPPYTYVFQ
jgi:hypothetical protein